MINTENMRCELKTFVHIVCHCNYDIRFSKMKEVMHLLNGVDIKENFGQG